VCDDGDGDVQAVVQCARRRPNNDEHWQFVWLW
jgi:hypothetical protein